MSALLDEIIRFRKEKAGKYEEYLKRIAELATKVAAGQDEGLPAALDTPGKRALYNNLKLHERAPQAADKVGEYMSSGDTEADLALQLDATVRQTRPDGWRGIQARENQIKAALLPLLGFNMPEVERIFLIIKQQPEY